MSWAELGTRKHLLTHSMTSQVEGNIVARSSGPDNNDLLSGVFLRSRVLESMDDLSLELLLQDTANQPRVFEREEIWEK